MIKPFQTDATIAREQDDALFEDLLDQCVKEPTPPSVGELLNSIDPQQPRSEKLLDDAMAILQTVGEIKQNADKCCARRFDSLVKKTAPKYTSGWLRANVERRYTHGQYGTIEYKTLALCQHGSFIDWPQIGPDGKTQRKPLQRCQFYPVLITETMQMAFARATKGRITYLREEVVKGSVQCIGGTLFKVAIHFPKDTQQGNAIITLEHASGGEWCRLEFLFDGEQFRLENMVSTEPFFAKGYEAAVKEELFEQPEGLDKFLNRCFKPFRFTRLDSDCKNLEDFLRECKYKVGITEVAQTPFLILHKDDRLL